jgi:hypothetical protein
LLSETTSTQNSRKSKTRSCHWPRKWATLSLKSWIHPSL